MRAWALARFACAVFSWFVGRRAVDAGEDLPRRDGGTSRDIHLGQDSCPLEVQREVFGRDRVPGRRNRLRHRARAHRCLGLGRGCGALCSERCDAEGHEAGRAHREHRVQHQGLALHGLVPSVTKPWPPFGRSGAQTSLAALNESLPRSMDTGA